jgi:type II secretory pathway pseudopilin PulG
MVVAIIGIIAAIAIPNLLTAIQKAKQRRTMADMRSIAVAWESRAADLNRYNAAGGVMGASSPVTMEQLTGALAPRYMKDMPQTDGWGKPYLCFTDADWGSSTPATRYVIMSGGSDRATSNAVLEGPTTSFDCDIVYSNGSFVAYPQGAQKTSPTTTP